MFDARVWRESPTGDDFGASCVLRAFAVGSRAVLAAVELRGTWFRASEKDDGAVAGSGTLARTWIITKNRYVPNAYQHALNHNGPALGS
jgi:hypothetical protein